MLHKMQCTNICNPREISTMSFLQCLCYTVLQYILIYLGFYIAFNTVQVISQRVVERAEETSTYSLSEFCTLNCQPTVSNYQLSHLRLCRELNPSLRGGRRECYHSATVAPYSIFSNKSKYPVVYCIVFYIMPNSWNARGYQYIELVKVL